jgi:hypothetical protein
MKGFRFYLEYLSPAAKRKGTIKKPGINMGTVIAMFTGEEHVIISSKDIKSECVAAVFDYENSPVCCCSASWDYLRENCRRVPESLARKIHPALFERLDSVD